MTELLIRFLAGGSFVSLFALAGDVLGPKSFAGLFGAAPSVALATLILTVRSRGAAYAAIEARSMLASAIAFFVYASVASWILMRYKPKALWVAIGSMPAWFGVAFGLWFCFLK